MKGIKLQFSENEMAAVKRLQKAHGMVSVSETIRHCALNFADGVQRIFLDKGVITPVPKTENKPA
jgi:hypothetical protein